MNLLNVQPCRFHFDFDFVLNLYAMPKLRFTFTDVITMCRCCESQVVDWRVAQIYDVDARCFVLKMNSVGCAEKRLLILESDVRFGLARHDAKSGEIPSALRAKLHATLKGKRLSDVRVLGDDRVVLFRFGSGTTAANMILELYAIGNIVLTDANYVVTAVLRARHNFADGATLEVGEPYPVASSAVVSVQFR